VPHERGMCFGSLRRGAPRTVEEIALWRLSMLRRLEPLPWFILAGWPVLGTCFPISNPQSSRILSMGLSTATFVSDVMSTLPLAMAISHAAAAIIDVLPVPVGPQLQGSRTAVGTAPAPTPPSAAGPALPHGGLGSREGFALRRLRHDSVQPASIFV